VTRHPRSARPVRGDLRRTTPAGLLCLAPLIVAGITLLTSGCTAPQRQAREEANERWKHVRAQVKLRLASDQLAAGHAEKAAAELSEALRLDPSDPHLRTLQARVLLAQGDHATAQRDLLGIDTSTAPSELRAYTEYLLGTIEQQRRHWDEAFNHFVRAAHEDPDDVAYPVAIVQNMLQLGEAREALDFLRAHEDKFGWTGAFQAALAECHEQLGNWPAAVAAWEQVADGNSIPFVRERLALALHRCQRWPEAATHLEWLLENDAKPPTAPLRLALAHCLLETQRPAEAQKQLALVLRDDPPNAPALQLLARCFAEQGQFDRARQTADRALQLAPDDPQALELVAALAFHSGDRKKARALAQRIAVVAPGTPSPLAERILAPQASAEK